MSDPEAPIEISPKTVFCPAHGEHLRENWPSGFIPAVMVMLEHVFLSEKMIEACGGNTDINANVGKINEVLAHRPMCFFVEKEIIRKALLETGVMSIALCTICKRIGMGGPYTLDVKGTWDKLPHMCVECALVAGDNLHMDANMNPKKKVWRDEAS